MTNKTEQLEFTGERFVPGEHGDIALEHLHRYVQACGIVAGKIALDIACGEGYGSAILANKASQVIGVDIARDAVQHARKRYKKENLKYMVGSCAEIPLPDASVDVVVSFETIEHHDQHDRMIQEIKRVLRPDGVLLISNPDKYYYSIERGYSNPHHIKELYHHEFKHLIETYFRNCAYFGQRIVYGSGIFAESMSSQQARTYWLEDDVVKESDGLPNPYYRIAVASDGRLPLLPSGIFAQPVDEIAGIIERDKLIADLQGEVFRRGEWGTSLDAVIVGQCEQISRLNDELFRRGDWGLSLDAVIEEHRGQIGCLHQTLSERDAQISSLAEQVLALETALRDESARFNAIARSSSWRLTVPLREMMRWVTAPRQQGKRYARGILSLGKRIYHALPLNFTPFRLTVGAGPPETVAALVPPPAGDTQEDLIVRYIDLLAGIDAIEIRGSLHPVVSIIIPVYGQIEYTLRCLASIAKHTPVAAFEVIVVDDRSPDLSVRVFNHVKGIRLIRNEENQGFIRSCNKGADAAKGQYLLFLNNDTEVTAGWMDELLQTFREFPGTGYVGSKLVYPDGTLQEAGGIIWQDGSAWNFGRHQNPLRPVFNYAREVDYCSGASIMVPKQLFAELGGFDEYYLPAYCEDSDLALKVRDRGYRVIYQPLSVAVHYEGVTSGTDLSSGTKAYQVVNSQKLFQRWKHRLQHHQANGVDADNAKDRRARRRALVIDHCTPTPDQDSGSIDTYNIMLLLREMDFQVTFIPEDNFRYMPEYTTLLQRQGIEALYGPYVMSVEQHLQEHGSRYQLVFLIRKGVVDRNLDVVRQYCPNAKVLFHTVDLHFLRMAREAALFADTKKQKAAEQVRESELALMKRVDVTTVISEKELEELSRILPDSNVRLLPYARHVRGTDSVFNKRRDIVFVGSYQHPPNIDAILYFAGEIMPLLRESLPGVCLHVVGSNPTDEVRELAANDIIVHGFVEDLESLLDKMRVNVAPLRYGAGIKGKIGSAMAQGLPTVATAIAAEGMSLTNGENILIADDAREFCDAISGLYNDEALWNRLSQNGLQFAEHAWGAEAVWKILAGILGGVGFDILRGSNALTLYSPPVTEVIEIYGSSTPCVSVIIPIYGQIEYTLRCLASIAKHTAPDAAFEVIVVDDCSPDNSLKALGAVRGIRLIRNEDNQGFIRSCNKGAHAAKGEYLLFLNNDTEVTPGWMDELLHTFSEFPGTGFAGSKLIYPDGTLQEAGGIIWRDGSAWNFGRNQDPSLPVYNYAREVDYCSGASIMVPKQLFTELGGFDEQYLPAYCEDSDLALKIRDLGYRVIYQPMSVVVHYEGATSGTDLATGAKAYQVVNGQKLFQRWERRLKRHQANGVDVDNAKDRQAKRRVLVMNHHVPAPDQDSGSLDAYNIMLLLREMGFQVTFMPGSLSYAPKYTRELQRAGIEVIYAPYVTTFEQHLEEYGDRYQLAFLFRIGIVEGCLELIRKYCSKAKVIFYTGDLHFLRLLREAALFSDPKMQEAAEQMRRKELALIKEADVTTVVSAQELAELSRVIPGVNVKLLPYARNIRGTDCVFNERRDIVFVGSYQHPPNVDAVHYFAGEIMPLLRETLPGVCFHVVGSNPTDAIWKLAAKDIVVHGYVEDLESLLDKVRVNIAPLRYGAGIKGKIGSAMAAGLPTVATAIAAEGMSLTNGENILIADGAREYCDAIARLYNDEALWNRLSQNGLQFAEHAWGAEAAWNVLAQIINGLGLDVTRGLYALTLYAQQGNPILPFTPAREHDAALRESGDTYTGTVESHHSFIQGGDQFSGKSAVIKAKVQAGPGAMVLVIDHHVPQPDRDAGSRTMMQWMALLLDHGMNVKFWSASQQYVPGYTERLQGMGVEIISGGQSLFENWLKENGSSLRHVLLSRPHIAVAYLPSIKTFTKAVIHFYGHDIHYLRIQEERKIKPKENKLAEEEVYWRALEHRVWKEADNIYYLSSSEKEHVRSWLEANECHANVRTIPCFAFDRFCENVAQGLAMRKDILMVAGFGHPPNVDGAVWFVSEIVPFIHSKHPDAHIYLVGSNPSNEVLKLASPGITVTGFVSDEELAGYYERARVAVAPLRYGAGVKGKVIESLRFGVPMITTSTGGQGLMDIPNAIMVTDDPRSFAEHVLRLLDDDDAWLKQAAEAVKAAKSYFSREAMLNAIAKEFDLATDVPSKRSEDETAQLGV
ncbi:glycosyltransferase [Candidatus Methylospira mobilis]|uniref:glycosyltransferase n=1 Tax=Candidatus Methylospira mobilis TaxID=1808979 RepID=UPI0028EB2B73|nr:glycosyltransferase [Candidatus Methylospira mobilis]WNV05355.1 glycosyltransferase [Candidatus Methylospira mobilis]